MCIETHKCAAAWIVQTLRSNFIIEDDETRLARERADWMRMHEAILAEGGSLDSD